MSEKCLILLTKTYPFGNGEQYITNELFVLSNYFSRIIIYPNDYYGSTLEHDKELPANVEVAHINSTIEKRSNNTFFDYLYLFKVIIREFVFTDDKKNFIKNFKWNSINFWTQLQLSKSFEKYLEKESFNPEKTIFYSYWFHKSAILLSIIKEKGIIEKFYSRAHSIDLYHQHWGIVNKELKSPPFKMFKLKNVSKLFSVSDHGTNFLKKEFPKYSKKISTSYLGVNSIEKKSHSNLFQNTFHVVTCSGMDINKRVHRLAESLIACNENIHWTHFGSGKMIEEVKKNITKFPSNITCELKGVTPNKDIIQFYRENKVDLFINLSIVEGLPVSIMEVLAFGIPVLATAVYGTPEAVIENYNGFLLPVDFSNELLKEKLVYCTQNSKIMQVMGENSRTIFNEKFNAEKNYNSFAQLINE